MKNVANNYYWDILIKRLQTVFNFATFYDFKFLFYTEQL